MAAVEQLSQTKPSQLHVRTYINIYTSRHTFMYACACINTHTHSHTCMHTYIYSVYIYMCVYAQKACYANVYEGVCI